MIPEHAGAWELVSRQLLSPLALMLFAASALAYVAGEAIDAVVILVIFGANALLAFGQEYHAEWTSKRLTRRLQPSVDVVRNGVEMVLPSRDVVPGDIVLLEAGDLVPADARIIEAQDLSVDESVLTGESLPVQKSVAPVKHRRITHINASCMLFGGTSVLSGSARAMITATGLHTEAGELLALAAERDEPSAFELLVGKVNAFIIKLTGGVLLLVFIAQLFLRPEVHLPDRLLFFVALAIMMVPEALPAVVTIAFSRASLKLAKRSVLVRKLSAIEELGHVNVLCVDKTGTLTEGRMSVVEVRGDEDRLRMFIAATAGKHAPHTTSGMAYEAALKEYAAGYRDASGTVLHVVPFDPIRRRSSKVVEHNGKCYLFVQGAPETVLPMCTGGEPGSWMEMYRDMGAAGERTLMFAYRELSSPTADADDERDLHLLGLIGFSDPVRSTSEAAIMAAKALRVEVKILTGDSVEVALAVGKRTGLVPKHARAVTGEAFMQATREERMLLVRECSIFARVSPSEKYAIVKLLASDGNRVAFMGDGMNDAPALKAAHVGLAVASAADIAKASADMILLKSDLHVIVEAIAYGRETFSNVKKYLFATLIGNFGNFVTASVLSLAIPFLPLLPIQILLLNFLTDFPMIAVSSDTVDAEGRATPRSLGMRELFTVTVVLGLVSSFFDFASFATFQAMSPDKVRTLWFSVSVFTELLLIFSIRSWQPVWKGPWPGLALTLTSVATGCITLALPYSDIGHRWFGFQSPSAIEISILLALAVIYFGVTESVKTAVHASLQKHV